jgi:hypothetical protein
MGPALHQTVALLLQAHPDGVDAQNGEGQTALGVGKHTGAPEEALSLVRRAEFMSSATQSLLG